MKPSPPQTVRCGRCGSDQRFAPGVSGMLCRACTGKIVLPADKKLFKNVLSLLDEDLLLFAPTGEHWLVNSKRRVAS